MFAITALASAGLYYSARHEMTFFNTQWLRVIKSPLTVNLVLFLFGFGVLADRWTKKMPKWKGWLIWGAGMLVIILIFRFIGGNKTTFG